MKYHFGQFEHFTLSFMCGYHKILHKVFTVSESPVVILLFITRSQLLSLRRTEPGMGGKQEKNFLGLNEGNRKISKKNPGCLLNGSNTCPYFNPSFCRLQYTYFIPVTILETTMSLLI
jgi:hypothetical protein